MIRYTFSVLACLTALLSAAGAGKSSASISAACITFSSRPANSLSRSFGTASALGSGPVYPVISLNNGAARFAKQGRSDGFGAFKVLWIVRPSYHGALAVTGSRIDQQGPLRFASGTDNGLKTSVFRRPAYRTRAWRGYPSTVLVRSAGCYSMKIAGASFTRRVSFRIVR